MSSNWAQGKANSTYHFDWQREEMPGHDFKWLSRFEGDWDQQLEKIKKQAKPKPGQLEEKITTLIILILKQNKMISNKQAWTQIK